MATSIWIEEESGSCTTYRHPHNGYYAGDFSHSARRPSQAIPSHTTFPRGVLS